MSEQESASAVPRVQRERAPDWVINPRTFSSQWLVWLTREAVDPIPPIPIDAEVEDRL